MVGPVVQVQLVTLAIELELAGGNAVAVAADDGAEEILVLGVAGEIVVAEDDITRVALPIGHGQRHHDGPVVDDPDLGPVAVAQGVEGNLLAVGKLAERAGSDGRAGRFGRFGGGRRWSGQRQCQGNGGEGGGGDDYGPHDGVSSLATRWPRLADRQWRRSGCWCSDRRCPNRCRPCAPGRSTSPRCRRGGARDGP